MLEMVLSLALTLRGLQLPLSQPCASTRRVYKAMHSAVRLREGELCVGAQYVNCTT